MSVELTVDAGVARLRLKRPEALNAFDRALTRDVVRAVAEIRTRTDVRVVVTSGDGRAYCAGSDVREIAPLSAEEAGELEAAQAEMAAAFDTLPHVSIAALHGYALGGGLGFALYHDLRVAADDAVFGLPEVPLGWTPPWAVGRLVDAVGMARAKWLLLTGERITAQRAAEWGLIHESIPVGEFDSHVNALASRLASLSRTALTLTRQMLVQASPWANGRWDAEANARFVECYRQPEARVALQQFLQRKRA